jgi:hypothetical protein
MYPIDGSWRLIKTLNNSLMMNYGYGSMMGGIGSFGFLVGIIILVDLVLAGIWLWQQISKK